MDINALLKWFEIDLAQESSWWQVLALFIIVPLVYVLNRYTARYLTRFNAPGKKKLQHLSFRTAERLLAPLIALGLFLVARSLLNTSGYPYKIIDIAIPVVTALAVIRVAVYLLRKAFPITPLLKAWENILVFVVWLLFVLHIIGWLDDVISYLDDIAIKFGETKITLLGTFKAVISVVFFILLALWISNRIEASISRSTQLANYLKLGISKTIRVIILIIAFLISLDLIGFDLTALTVLGGALGVGIGFGLQRIASNFISGFILLFDRSIRPNDVISIGDSFGWVKELRARYVVIQDRDGVETLIPNENLVTSQVINWSYTDRSIRIKIPIQISYNDDPAFAMKLLVEAANESPRLLQDPPAVARLMSFGDHGVNLELRLWITDPENGVNNLRSEVNLSIWDKFKQHGITIPFPQRDVHLMKSQEENKSGED